jgi:hypothetical protein
MKLKSLQFVFLLFVLNLYTDLSIAAEDISYKGVQIGDSLEKFKKTFPDQECLTDEGCHYYDTLSCLESMRAQNSTNQTILDCFKRNTFGGVHVKSAQSTFSNKRLVSYRLIISPSSFESLLESVSLKIGSPTTIDNFEVKNKMNASYMNIEAEWVSSSTIVTLKKYCGSLDRACIKVTSVEENERHKAQLKLDKAKAAQDF